jgi:hypothetical protein
MISWLHKEKELPRVQNIIKTMTGFKDAVVHDVAGVGDCFFLALYVAMGFFFGEPFGAHLHSPGMLRWLAAGLIINNIDKIPFTGFRQLPGFARGYAEEALYLSHRFCQVDGAWEAVGRMTAFANSGIEGCIADYFKCNLIILYRQNGQVECTKTGWVGGGKGAIFLFFTGNHYRPIISGTITPATHNFRQALRLETLRYLSSTKSFLFRNIIPVHPEYVFHSYASAGPMVRDEEAKQKLRLTLEPYVSLHNREQEVFSNIIASAKIFLFCVLDGTEDDGDVLLCLKIALAKV